MNKVWLLKFVVCWFKTAKACQDQVKSIWSRSSKPLLQRLKQAKQPLIVVEQVK
jgi:hypothetical protein